MGDDGKDDGRVRGSEQILWQYETVIYILSHGNLEALQQLHQFNHRKCPVSLIT